MPHGQLLLKPLPKEKDLSEFQHFGTKEPLWKMKKIQNGSFYPARYLPCTEKTWITLQKSMEKKFHRKS